jgi:hypothetical protein
MSRRAASDFCAANAEAFGTAAGAPLATGTPTCGSGSWMRQALDMELKSGPLVELGNQARSAAGW